MDQALVWRLRHSRRIGLWRGRHLDTLVVTAAGGSATDIGTTIAAQNLGVLFAPFWGMITDRTRTFRTVFILGFILIGLGFLGLSVLQGLGSGLIL